MPYTATSWTNGTTPVNATNMNHLETQFQNALFSFNPDMLTAFVKNGLTPTKDGSIANQLDISSGTAYVKQNDFGEPFHIAFGSQTTFTTSTPSSTYFLYLQPDGTWFWSTSNTPAANSLFIAQVTTDGSGNIATVTDKRQLVVFMFSTASGAVAANALGSTQTAMAYLQEVDNGTDIFDNLLSMDSGSRKRHLRANTGSNVQIDFLVGSTDGSVTFPKNIASVSGVTTAGGLGVPVIVAQLVRSHVTTTGLATLLTYAVTATGVYRVSGYISLNNGSADPAISATVGSTDPDTSTATAENFFTGKVPLSGGTAHSPTLLDGVATFGRNNSNIVLAPLLVAAASGSNILCNYNDPSGTPSDYVTFIIERLA